MSTKMPRENIYITDEIKSTIERYSALLEVSKSEYCRRVFQFWMDIHNAPESTAVYGLAKAKDVTPAEVILACVRKQIPPKYFSGGEQ